MSTSDPKDSSFKPNSPKNRPSLTSSPGIHRLKASPSFKIHVVGKNQHKERPIHGRSCSADFMEMFREVACYQPSALESPLPYKKVAKLQSKASLGNSNLELSSKAVNNWRPKEDNPIFVEPMLAVHNVFGKTFEKNQLSDTLTSFNRTSNRANEHTNTHNNILFYLEDQESKGKSQKKTKFPQLKSFSFRTAYDSPRRQKTERLEETKTQFKPYKIHNNFKKNYTVREYDHCVSKELVEVINSKEKSSMLSSRDNSQSPKKLNNSKEMTHPSISRSLSAPKIQAFVANITISEEWKSGLSKAKPQDKRSGGDIIKEETMFRSTVLQPLYSKHTMIKNQSFVNKKGDKQMYSWTQVASRTSGLRKFGGGSNYEKDEDDLQLSVTITRRQDGAKDPKFY